MPLTRGVRRDTWLRRTFELLRRRWQLTPLSALEFGLVKIPGRRPRQALEGVVG